MIKLVGSRENYKHWKYETGFRYLCIATWVCGACITWLIVFRRTEEGCRQKSRQDWPKFKRRMLKSTDWGYVYKCGYHSRVYSNQSLRCLLYCNLQNIPQDEELSKRVKSLETEVSAVPLTRTGGYTARVSYILCPVSACSWSVCKGSCLVTRRSVRAMRAGKSLCRTRW